MPFTRRALCTMTLLLPMSLLAHHGWSSFDETRPIYLEGVVRSVKWQNPHAEVVLEVSRKEAPVKLATLPVPAQTAQVDAGKVFANAKPPQRRDLQWMIELAPLTRMQAWKVDEIKPGERIAVVGYTFKDEQGSATLRAEYLIRNEKVTPLRSAPL